MTVDDPGLRVISLKLPCIRDHFEESCLHMTMTRKSLPQLFFPLFLETLCSILAGIVDTLMLSIEGDQAVGAVGTATTYINIFVILFLVISTGMTAVMTQYIGSGRPGIAQRVMRLGLGFNLVIGTAVTLVLFFFGGNILVGIGIADQLLEPAGIYLRTVGLFCICNALIPVFSSYLRSFGHTAPSMAGTLLANGINIVLNALFLLVFHWGVFGVALATGISRLFHLLWIWVASGRLIPPVPDAAPPENRELLKKVIRIGLPGAMENCMYNLAITIVISLLNGMDDAGIQATARTYAAQIANFSVSTGIALAQSNAILVGWRIGAGELEACDRGTRRVALLGIGLAVGIAGFFALMARPVLQVFTRDPEMIRLVSRLLVVDIFLEVGRVCNLVFGDALKTSGDAVYPMAVAVVFAFLCAAAGTWFFGVRLGWLAFGAYLAMALDECVRAVCMFLRWQKGAWKNKRLS